MAARPRLDAVLVPVHNTQALPDAGPLAFYVRPLWACGT